METRANPPETVAPSDLPVPDLTPEGVPIPAFTPWRAKRVRVNGWCPATQRSFIAELTRIGSPAAAAKAVGRSARSAYLLREKEGAESFAAAWDAAIMHGRKAAHSVAIDRALYGEITPIYRKGQFWGFRIKQNDRLLAAAVRAYDKTGRPDEDVRRRLEKWEIQLRRQAINPSDPDLHGKALADAEEDHRVWAIEMEREQRRQRNAEIRAAVRKGLAPKKPPEPRVRGL